MIHPNLLRFVESKGLPFWQGCMPWKLLRFPSFYCIGWFSVLVSQVGCSAISLIVGVSPILNPWEISPVYTWEIEFNNPKNLMTVWGDNQGFQNKIVFRFTPKILNIFLHNPHRIFKVIAVLVALVFSQKILPFQGPLDHVEAFAGDQAVTLGELEDYGGVSKIFSQTSKGNPGNMIFSYPQVFEPKNRGHFGYNFWNAIGCFKIMLLVPTVGKPACNRNGHQDGPILWHSD